MWSRALQAFLLFNSLKLQNGLDLKRAMLMASPLDFARLALNWIRQMNIFSVGHCVGCASDKRASCLNVLRKQINLFINSSRS